MRILLANEPRSYRDAFASALHILRPHHEVLTVEPGDLDQEARRLRPHLVMCEHATPNVRSVAGFWIVVRVEDETLVVSATVGKRGPMRPTSGSSNFSTSSWTEPRRNNGETKPWPMTG